MSGEVEVGSIMGCVVVKMLICSGAKEMDGIVSDFFPECDLSEDFSFCLLLGFFENSYEVSKATVRIQYGQRNDTN